MEQEKRIRREIANSNERRRMQSINAGFQSLRTLLPHHEGEKLSKSTNAYIALRNGVSIPSDRKSFITLEPTRIGPGQADTWTGNDGLPLFDKVNSSIKLNLFCVWTRLRKPLSAAFMNRRMFSNFG
ncbi:Transcription factor AP-4 [Camponotus floridanus]|uniref:Transcription factor AP-4 n=1 Tax=Camponotus floridanus TaxID=104421 RepID=E2A1V1_CAMFO|nr:Transcription factor AP-4 [Camponotus floridanus]